MVSIKPHQGKVDTRLTAGGYLYRVSPGASCSALKSSRYLEGLPCTPGACAGFARVSPSQMR